ncbi:MAG: YabP/YqfC family sporulation protein [Clostridia bacterium]|nr:YabP/YqfC family sporulation protein [Clostridia bacterium]
MGERKHEDRGGMKERLCRALDLSPDIFPGETLVELRGRGSLSVSGCRGILDYTPELIRLSLKKGNLLIEGRRLSCASYLAGSVGIDGQIDSLRFEEM